CSGWPRTTQAILLAAGVLVGAGLTTRPASTQATDAKVDTHVTLSVYTCCGSLAGFNDTTPTDLTSMHALYAGRWAQLFPHLPWRETAFTDQRAMETRLAAAVRVGTPPDMVFVQGGDSGDPVVRGLAQPLDRYFTREHIPDGYFLPSMGHWAHLGGHWWAIPAVSGPLGGQQIFLPKYMAP